MRRIPLALTLAVLLAGTAACSGGDPGGGQTTAETGTTTSAAAPQPDVIVNLWEWNWPSVARECTEVLGPAGYAAVQVAPPQDSLSKSEPGTDGTVHPWWEVYQPVSYQLTSRMGDEAAFTAMVKACADAGVHVVVDAVINHMTGQGSTSYGGVTYSKYEYPGLYTAADFHQKGSDCGTPTGEIGNYDNYDEVTRCELVGLSDLKTGSERVRGILADYLNKLIGLGVWGFRIDAAKHMGPDDIAAIAAELDPLPGGGKPYVSLEVIPGPGKLDPSAYTGIGQALNFSFAGQLKGAFTSGVLVSLKTVVGGSLSSDQSVAFTQNHDTERNGQSLSYRDGARNVLADRFLLAYGYGRPQIYSSFEFVGSDDSPPAAADGRINDTVCGTGWTCVHRDPTVLRMVGFHNRVAGQPLANWSDDQFGFIAFSRGAAGFFAANGGPDPVSRTVPTGLPAGEYCDLGRGEVKDGACTGPTVTVGADGTAALTVGPTESVAFTTAERLG